MVKTFEAQRNYQHSDYTYYCTSYCESGKKGQNIWESFFLGISRLKLGFKHTAMSNRQPMKLRKG